MSASQTMQSKDTLQDSWVELHYRNGNNGNGQTGVAEPQTSQLIYPENLEKLLIEAQKESANASRNNSREASARGSPKSPHSPSIELASNTSSQDERERDPGMEWMWDWSSRPEAIPPRDFNGKFKHPMTRKSKLSVRNTPVMRSGIFRVFQLENLPILLFSHACAVFLGAAGLFIYLKKFHWPRAEILSYSIE